MKIYSDEKLIKRNRRIGNITSILSILILGVGMVFSFRDKDGSYLIYTFSSLIVGFLLFQIGNFYMTKWGKSPRPDERITSALKGLDDKYTLYHYTTPVSHLLVGPSGVLCLIPYGQSGTISYDATKNKWKQMGGNFFLKTFGGESLGNPEKEIRYTLEDTKKFLDKNQVLINDFEPEAVLVFTNPSVVLEADEYEGAAVSAGKLKDFIRKRAKNVAFPDDLTQKIEKIVNP